MFDHYENNHAGYYCRRQRHMRRKVVQNDTVTGDQNDYSHRQHPSARTRAAMSSHAFDPLVTWPPSSTARDLGENKLQVANSHDSAFDTVQAGFAQQINYVGEFDIAMAVKMGEKTFPFGRG